MRLRTITRSRRSRQVASPAPREFRRVSVRGGSRSRASPCRRWPPSRAGRSGSRRAAREGSGSRRPLALRSSSARFLLHVVAFDLNALLAHLVLDRLLLGLNVLLDGDAFLRHGLLLHDRLLAVQRHLDLVFAELVLAPRLVDPLAGHSRDLVLQPAVERDRLGLDPLAQATAAGLDLALADHDFLFRARDGLILVALRL